MLALTFLVVLPLAADPAPADVPLPTSVNQQPATERGAAMAPAALPAGSMAFWGTIGAPEVAAGYRQGFAPLELEAIVHFNYLQLALIAEAGIRIGAWKSARTIVAPTVSLGLSFNSGVRAFDPFNFASVGLRPRAGLVVSIGVSDVLQVLALVDVPWTIALNVQGFQVTPTVGSGVEFSLNQKLSLVGIGQIGVDLIKEPLGIVVPRLGWAIRLGVGYRLF